jgi:transglutaminase-like putative cysteine protease
VSAPPGRRYYWRSRIFDIYERGRWTPAADNRLNYPDAPLELNLGSEIAGSAREPVEQEFTIGLNASRLVYAAPQPLRIDLPTRTDLRYIDSDTKVMNVSVIRPMKVLYRGESYTATSLLSTATADQLRATSTDYPRWVRDLYLPLSMSVTTRTVNLSNQIIAQAGATTAYDKAKAIEGWLRANIVYNETIPQPPSTQDPVDWVLFDLKQGYCVYYASAMIVMLRSQGIPARMAAGFAQGTWDAETQTFVVRERDAHIWVEAYFPGYGWIEFEPTAAQAPLERIGDASAAPQPPSTPFASPTQTATPTPTATLTPSPTQPADPTQAAQQLQNPPQPTITPTYTPSPTATPVIVPTQPPPITPQPRGLLSFLLPALALALLGLLLIGLLVAIGVFIWWWWEWRGMKGLSPVVRAYARLERYIGLLGIRLHAQQTPEERRRHIMKDLPGAERPVTAITRLYTAERYGPDRQDPVKEPANAQMADKAWMDARTTILQRFLRRFLPGFRRR